MFPAEINLSLANLRGIDFSARTFCGRKLGLRHETERDEP